MKFVAHGKLCREVGRVLLSKNNMSTRLLLYLVQELQEQPVEVSTNPQLQRYDTCLGLIPTHIVCVIPVPPMPPKGRDRKGTEVHHPCVTS